jgi:Protein of unknown function (DUF2934)
MASKAKHGGRSKGVEPGTDTQEQGRLSASTREDKIRRRAYELYVERGREPGRDIEDWLQAARELTGHKSNAAGA